MSHNYSLFYKQFYVWKGHAYFLWTMHFSHATSVDAVKYIFRIWYCWQSATHTHTHTPQHLKTSVNS